LSTHLPVKDNQKLFGHRELPENSQMDQRRLMGFGIEFGIVIRIFQQDAHGLAVVKSRSRFAGLNYVVTDSERLVRAGLRLTRARLNIDSLLF
jgi:hypothetical protein